MNYYEINISDQYNNTSKLYYKTNGAAEEIVDMFYDFGIIYDIMHPYFNDNLDVDKQSYASEEDYEWAIEESFDEYYDSIKIELTLLSKDEVLKLENNGVFFETPRWENF
jgi:hypothetical protein